MIDHLKLICFVLKVVLKTWVLAKEMMPYEESLATSMGQWVWVKLMFISPIYFKIAKFYQIIEERRSGVVNRVAPLPQWKSTLAYILIRTVIIVKPLSGFLYTKPRFDPGSGEVFCHFDLQNSLIFFFFLFSNFFWLFGFSIFYSSYFSSSYFSSTYFSSLK